MTKKKPKKMRTSAVKVQVNSQRIDRIDPRKKLLARVAGDVASGLVAAPSPSISSSDGIATVAVDIAEQILKKAGIPVEVAAEPSAEIPNEPNAAAS